MKTLSVDIGATHIKWAILPDAPNRESLAKIHVASMRSLGWLNAGLAGAFDRDNWPSITHESRNLGQYDRVAIGLCSEIDTDGNVVGNLRSRGVPSDFIAAVERHVAPRSVTVVNDAEAWMRGAIQYERLCGRNVKFPALALIFGTGIGCCMASSDFVYEPIEFCSPIQLNNLARASGKPTPLAPDKVHGMLGKEFFDWVGEAQRDLSYHRIREEYTNRVAALLKDMAAHWGNPATIILGGGNAEYVQARRLANEAGVEVVPLRNNELGSVSPDLIPLLGAAGFKY